VCAEVEKKEICASLTVVSKVVTQEGFENKAPARPSFVRFSNLVQFMQNVKSAVHMQRFV
jgi:hypothetical protein